MSLKRERTDRVALVLVHAEVDAFEQFLQYDEPGAAPRGFADVAFYLVEIGFDLIGAGNLDCGGNQLAHGSPHRGFAVV
jgi:hypothetical protein